MKSFESPSEHDNLSESLRPERESEPQGEEYGTPEFDPGKINPEKLRGKIDEALDEAADSDEGGGD